MWGENDLQEVGSTYQKTFQCFLCSEKFALAPDLAIHIKNHDIPRVFRCGLCDERFYENSELLAHVSSLHGGLPLLYNCSICKQAFQELLTLEQHIAGCKVNVSNSSISGNAAGKTENEQGSTINKHGHESKGKDLENLMSSDSNTVLGDIQLQNDIYSKMCNTQSQKNTEDQVAEEPCDELDESCYENASSNLIEQDELSSQNVLPIAFDNSSDTTDTQLLSYNINDTNTNSNSYRCKTCPESFENVESLRVHMCSDNLERYFCIYCLKCKRFFEDMNAVEQHLTNTDCGGWQCQLCSKSFSLEAFLIKHNVLDHKYELNCVKKCSACSKSFTLADDWANHEASHTKSLPFVCKLCNRRFRNMRAVRTYHLPFTHKLDPRLKSESKKSQFEKNNQFPLETEEAERQQQANHANKRKEYLRSQPIDLSNKPSFSSTMEKQWECRICPQQCNDRRELEQHIQSHTLDDCYIIQCVKCCNNFENTDLLKAHLESTDCLGYKCLECGRSFGLEAQLLKHNIMTHKQDSDNYICTECGKKWPSRIAWARHEATHAQSKPYVCKICGKCMSTLECVVRQHLPITHKLRKKKQNEVHCVSEVRSTFASTKIINDCNQSKQKFLKEPPPSKQHEKEELSLTYNNGEADGKNWKCNICMQHFDDDDKLNMHISSHALEDCYTIQCVKCHNFFDSTELLETHFESTGCSGFKCLECGQSFGLETQFLKHQVLAHKQDSDNYICSECGKMCPSRYAWARHEATHAKSQPYMCKICGKILSTLDITVRYHLQKFHKLNSNKQNRKSIVKYVSEICMQSSTQIIDDFYETNKPTSCKKQGISTEPLDNLTLETTITKEHSLEHHQNKQSKRERTPKMVCIDCDICGGKVSNKQALISHRSYHFITGKFTIKCSGCPEKFSQTGDLLSHIEQKQCSKFKCEYCQQVFPTELSFALHNFKVHSVFDPSGCYKCLECNKYFESFTVYVDHASEHVIEKPFQCKICNANFMSEVLLESHLQEIHSLIKNDQESNKYKCAQCLETFKSKMAIRVHRMFHRQREVLLENKDDINKPGSSFASYMTSSFCQICLVGFGTAIHLDRHEQMHSDGVNRPRCQICGLTFQRNGYLNIHMKQHSKPFLCTTCGKTFCSAPKLKEHNLAYHSAVNPYQCKVCHKFYSSKGVLHHHMKCHTGDKRFECKTCGKKFRDSTCLESHILNHSSEKRFKCSICNYQCRHRVVLTRHIEKHHGVQRSFCSN